MKNTSIVIAMSIATLVLAAVLKLDAAAFIPGIVGLALGGALLKAGKTGSEYTA